MSKTQNGEVQVYTPARANTFIRDDYLFLKPTITINDAKFYEIKLTTGAMDLHEMYGTCTTTANNSCRRDGHNSLIPTVMSAKIKSKHTIWYGKVEVRARIPKGDWIWPAIWMLPKDSKYGNAVANDSGGHNHGVTEVISTLHWGPSTSHNGFMKTHRGR